MSSFLTVSTFVLLCLLSATMLPVWAAFLSTVFVVPTLTILVARFLRDEPY